MAEPVASPGTLGATRSALPRPRLVVALDPAERGRAVAVWAGLLSAGLHADVDAVVLPAPVVRDFTVERAAATDAGPLLELIAAPRPVTVHPAGSSPAATLWALCHDATFLIVSESSAHLVMPLDPESYYPRSALPEHCAIVVVPDPSAAW